MSVSKGYLVLADGTRFEGVLYGALRTTVGEVAFTTGMTGYQEVITDPSYAGQIVVMTAPHIGNTGMNAEDNESARPALAGFVIHQASPLVSNWRSQEDLASYLVRQDVASISGIDTRSLTQHIRDHGAQLAAFGPDSPSDLHDLARSAPPMQGRDLASEVGTRSRYEWRQSEDGTDLNAPKYHVVCVDYGVKTHILRSLVNEGSRLTVVPPQTSADEILALNPDGIFLSNGPGDPAAVGYAVKNVQSLLGKKPIFGICLGHQILGLALGASSYKLKFGHRGLNQPVKDLATGRVEITTQNHGFCIDADTLPKDCLLTHVHLNDGSCEGISRPDLAAFSVQYHPEASAGPHDSKGLFQRFSKLMSDD